MIPFEIEQLRVEHVWLKDSTTALGGSIRVVDEERSTDDQEVYKKINVPMAIVRKFVNENKKVTRYLKPVLTAVTYYGDHAVALERHPYLKDGEVLTDLAGELAHWTSQSETNLDKFILPITRTNDWFVDGTFIYTFAEKDKNDAVALSGNNKFKAVSVRAFKLADIHKKDKMVAPEDRTCLLYNTSCGQEAMSPPIWKQLTGVGETQLGLTEDEDNGTVSADALGVITGNHQFDRIDELLAVNLAFALKAGQKIADVFGYDSIEPLGLDDLMIQLRTVNLPRVAKEVKQTFDIGIPFTHAIAWLLGLTARTETLDAYVVLRSLLKYLTTKGIYRKNSFVPSAVYRPDMSQKNVPSLTMEQAHKNVREQMDKLGATLIGSGWAAREVE